MDTVVNVNAGGAGIFTVRAGRGLRDEEREDRPGLRMGSGDRCGLASGHGNLQDRTSSQSRRAGGRTGEAVSQTGSGIAGWKTRRPCRQRSSRSLPDHTESRAQGTRAKPATAPA